MKHDTDILKVVGIDSMGYGKIPKLVMKDRRLTPEAKCIYGYFASYAGSGNSAFPTVSRIIHDLCMSEKRYYKHFKLLTHYGYISVEQVKVKGKFTHNLYNLNMEITEEKPSSQNDCTEKPSSRFAWTQNACTQNVGANINSSKNNSLEEEEGAKKSKVEEKTDEVNTENHQGGNDEETQIAKYRYLAQRVEATDQDLVEALKAMDNEPNLDTPVAWLITAIKNEKSNRELAERPKTKRDPKPSTKSRTTKKPKTDPAKYEKFYL